jgi:hypothetical protein
MSLSGTPTATRTITFPDATDTVVLLDETQTLTAKTLTTPTIGDFTNAGHDHEDAAGGATLASAATPSAIHDDVASEISAVTLKGTPVSGDFILIEDSAAANVKKRITVGSLPAGSEINDLASDGINGIADDQLAVGTGASTAAYQTLPNGAVSYSTAGGTFSQASSSDLSDGPFLTVEDNDLATDGINGIADDQLAVGTGASTAAYQTLPNGAVSYSTAGGTFSQASSSDLSDGPFLTVEDNDLATDGVNGIADDQIVIGSGASTAAYHTLPNGAVTYATGTNTVSQAALANLSDVTATTGTGSTVVFDTSPTIVTPTIASFTNATHNHEDAAGGNTLASAATPSAIHDDVASEISGLTLKGTPVSGDFLLIEDSAAANVKKYITVGSLPAGSEINDLASDGINGIADDQLAVGTGASTAAYQTLPNGAVSYSTAGGTFSQASSSDLSDGPFGDVTGPGSSLDNELVKFDSTTGKIIQASTSFQPTLADDGVLTLNNTLTFGTGTDITRNGSLNITLTGAATRTLLVQNSTASCDGVLRFQNNQVSVMTLSGTPTTNRTLTFPDATDTVVLLDETQTLTAKTLTTPTIGDFTNAAHNHEGATGGATLASAATPSAIHDDVASEISGLTVKGSPVSGDFIMIEDSAAGNVKKYITIGTLPAGGEINDLVGDGINGIADDQLAVGTGASTAAYQTLPNGAVSYATAGGTFSQAASTDLSDTSAIVLNNQSNTYTTGSQDFSACTLLKLPVIAGTTPTTSGLIEYDSTSDTLEYGSNGVNRVVVNTNETQILANKQLNGVVMNGTITGTISQSWDLSAATTLTFTLRNTTASEVVDFIVDGRIRFENNTSFYMRFDGTPTANRTHTIPDVADDTFAMLNATQTLAAKTLTTPTIASFTNATHNHQDAAGGGTLSHNSATDNPSSGTHGVTGSVVGTTDTQTLSAKDLTAESNKLRHSKSVTIEDPADGDRITMFMNERAITVLGVSFASAGGTSVLFNVEYGTTIASGTVVHTDTCATSTPEWDVTPSGDATIATDQIIMVEITTVTATVTDFHVTVYYDED